MKELIEKATALGIDIQVDGKDKDEATLTAEIKAAEEKAAADAKNSNSDGDSSDPFEKGLGKGATKIEFLKSPTGQFGLAYNAGDKAKVSKEQADILIENGYAKKV